ncbi:hypothetical protein CSA_023564, partial [Cucumis sativus]
LIILLQLQPYLMIAMVVPMLKSWWTCSQEEIVVYLFQ